VVPALGSVYSLEYWRNSTPARPKEGSRWLGLFYGMLAGSMALVVIARDGVLFLVAWEFMALAAYFALATEQDKPEVRRASWVYLVATHMGTLTLFALFALWRQATGSFALEPAAALPAGLSSALFVLALVGFSFKAGLFPLHFWLPGAHANAPSHLSAVMSGVLLKMGVYGIVRMTSLLPLPPLWWGGTLLAVGAVTGLLGILLALSQHDFKRLLAYSSVENVGIIALGVGLALLGRSLHRPDWIVLGLGGALLHVWNHGLFKALLFLNAGAILHATDTRDIERLGGLAQRMPQTAGLFAVGAVAICALPPLNGFAGEWLLYLGLFRTLDQAPAAALAAVALAMIGALAVACFVKLFGSVFLGVPRSTATAHAHDPQATMIMPMAALAAGCVCLGIFPALAVPWLERAAQTWAQVPENDTAALAPLAPLAPMGWISILGLALLGAVGALVLIVRLMRRAPVVGTWDCGYAQPTARMQYTGSSFGQTLVNLFRFALQPKRHLPDIQGVFPAQANFKSLVPDLVLDRLLLPFTRWAGEWLPLLRVFQQGQTQLYVLYVLMILIVLLAWAAVGPGF
jgi:hydrogenase-4 component B